MDATVYWSPGMSLEVLEQLVIQKAFRHYQSNKTATANSLGIAIRTLDAKLEKYTEDDKKLRLQHATRRDQRDVDLARHRGISPQGGQASAGQIIQANGKAEVGVRAEPIANATTQQPVPLSERQEVQEVLPKQASGNHSRRSR